MSYRTFSSGQIYHFAYQGQEKDPKIGEEAFELRSWDGRRDKRKITFLHNTFSLYLQFDLTGNLIWNRLCFLYRICHKW